eukprot:Sspe_Gene.89012::Locus_60885_Transcript_1_1_Confidence_1.000_Length_696::g.89012::m.89012
MAKLFFNCQETNKNDAALFCYVCLSEDHEGMIACDGVNCGRWVHTKCHPGDPPLDADRWFYCEHCQQIRSAAAKKALPPSCEICCNLGTSLSRCSGPCHRVLDAACGGQRTLGGEKVLECSDCCKMLVLHGYACWCCEGAEGQLDMLCKGRCFRVAHTSCYATYSEKTAYCPYCNTKRERDEDSPEDRPSKKGKSKKSASK